MVAGQRDHPERRISHALVLLTDHPEQRALLLADFEGRIAGAVEEIVRYRLAGDVHAAHADPGLPR